MKTEQDPPKGIKSYSWYARLAPMYLTILPVALGLGVWFPGEPSNKYIAGAVLLPAVFGVFFAERSRDRGRKLQPRLWGMWGGPLLAQYLRHRNDELNGLLRIEYHGKLQEVIPNLSIPTVDEEAADPEAADKIYEACAQHLVNVVREDPDRFPSAFKENKSLGFRRNLWGLKPFGIACSLTGAMACIAWIWFHWKGPETLAAGVTASLLLNFTMLIVWLFITADWVRVAYDAYARRTLESLQRMGTRDRLG